MENEFEQATDEAEQAVPEKAPKTKKAKVAKEPKVKVPGVIARLKHWLENGGGNVAELGEYLAADFPDRGAEGMLTTIRVQLQRLPTKSGYPINKERVPGRGMVYYAAGTNGNLEPVEKEGESEAAA